MNIGMQELLMISVLALIVLGPERLPTAIKTMAIWLNRARRSFNELKSAVEREINADEIRQHIHNDNVLHELGETRDALEQLGEQLGEQLSGNFDPQQASTSTRTEPAIGDKSTADTAPKSVAEKQSE